MSLGNKAWFSARLKLSEEHNEIRRERKGKKKKGMGGKDQR